MGFKLSPSSLGLMKDCPRCFWLDKHKVWQRPNMIFPSLPSGVDRVLKEHFDRFRVEGKLPPEICENGHCKHMKLFQDEQLLSEWRNNFKGVRWTDGNGNVLFGAVDNLLDNNGKLVVLDYKTKGFAVKDGSEDFYRDQLDIYNFLIRKNGFDTENFSFLLFYVPKDVTRTGEFVFDSHLKKVDNDVKNAEKIFHEAVKILNGDCPDKECSWCEGKDY